MIAVNGYLNLIDSSLDVICNANALSTNQIPTDPACDRTVQLLSVRSWLNCRLSEWAKVKVRRPVDRPKDFVGVTSAVVVVWYVVKEKLVVVWVGASHELLPDVVWVSVIVSWLVFDFESRMVTWNRYNSRSCVEDVKIDRR